VRQGFNPLALNLPTRRPSSPAPLSRIRSHISPVSTGMEIADVLVTMIEPVNNE